MTTTNDDGVTWAQTYEPLVRQFCQAREVGDGPGADAAFASILDAADGLIRRELTKRLPTSLRDGTKVTEDFVQEVHLAIFEALTQLTAEDADMFYKRLAGRHGLVRKTLLEAQQQWVLPNVCTAREHKVLRATHNAKKDLKLRLEREPTLDEIVAETTVLAHARATNAIIERGDAPTTQRIEAHLVKDGTRAALRRLPELLELEASVRASLAFGFDDHFHGAGSSPTARDIVAETAVDEGDSGSVLSDLAGACLSSQERSFVDAWSDAGGTAGITEVATQAGLTVPAARSAMARSAATFASPVAAFVTAGGADDLFEDEGPADDDGLGARLALATASLCW